MMYGRGMLHNGMWYGFMNSGWCWLIGLGILLIIVAVVFVLVKKNTNTASNSNTLEILKLKFAKGEITEEEYKKRKSVLEEK